MSLSLLTFKLTSQEFPPPPLQILANRGCQSKGQQNSQAAFDGVAACNQEKVQQDPLAARIVGIMPSIIVTDAGQAICCHDENLVALSGRKLKLRKLMPAQIKAFYLQPSK